MSRVAQLTTVEGELKSLQDTHSRAVEKYDIELRDLKTAVETKERELRDYRESEQKKHHEEIVLQESKSVEREDKMRCEYERKIAALTTQLNESREYANKEALANAELQAKQVALQDQISERDSKITELKDDTKLREVTEELSVVREALNVEKMNVKD